MAAPISASASACGPRTRLRAVSALLAAEFDVSIVRFLVCADDRRVHVRAAGEGSRRDRAPLGEGRGPIKSAATATRNPKADDHRAGGYGSGRTGRYPNRPGRRSTGCETCRCSATARLARYHASWRRVSAKRAGRGERCRRRKFTSPGSHLHSVRGVADLPSEGGLLVAVRASLSPLNSFRPNL